MLPRLKAALSRVLPRASFARSVSILVGGSATAQIITIGAMPIVTRLYSPAEIGVISLFVAFFGFWASTLSLRYEHALLIAENDKESHDVHRLAIILVVVMSVIGLPVLWGLKHSNTLEFGLLPDWAPMLAATIFICHGTFMVNRSWALRAGLIKSITKASVAKSAANATTRVGLGLFGSGVTGLFLAELAGACASMTRLAIATRRHFSHSRPDGFGIDRLTKIAKKYKKYPLIETPSTWLDSLTLTLPVPMMASLYGATAAGLFGLSRMVVAVPNSQIGTAVADVFQMELSKAVVERNGTQARTLFYSIMKKMALFGLIPLIGVLLFANWLMPLIFGQKWADAGQMAMIVAPWFYAALVVSPLSRSLSVLQAQEFKLIYDGFVLIALIAVFYVAKSSGLGLMWFLSLISVVNIIGYFIYAALLMHVVNRRIAFG